MSGGRREPDLNFFRLFSLPAICYDDGDDDDDDGDDDDDVLTLTHFPELI